MSRQQSLVSASPGICELYTTVIKHFFPDFWKQIDALDDPRKVLGRCQYGQRVFFATSLYKCFAGLRSHREMDDVFNGEGNSTMENLQLLTGEKLQHIPRGQSINYWLSMLNPDGLKTILDNMVMQLLRNKRLEECREPLEKSLICGSDGTGLICTIRPIEHSTIRNHKDGRCTRHVYVLLVAFLSPTGIVIPFHAEFIENDKDYNPEFDKQDCEHKAQLKLFDKIHKLHPKLPLTILMDALSLDYTQMMNCIDKQWDFVISYSEGAVKGLADAISATLASQKGCNTLQSSTMEADGTIVTREYTWFRVTYQFGKAQEKGNGGFPVMYAKMNETKTTAGGKVEIKTYERITSHCLTSGNVEVFFKYMGGTRWCEENQGFNEMKNLGLNIEHAYGCHGEAVVNHFLIQMIAFLIMQIAGKTNLYGKMKTFAEKNTEGKKDKAMGEGEGTKKQDANAEMSLRKAFSSMFAIAKKFLIEVAGRIIRCPDERAIAKMRIRWAYG